MLRQNKQYQKRANSPTITDVSLNNLVIVSLTKPANVMNNIYGKALYENTSENAFMFF